MKIYVINLCVDTKNTDRYDKVAVNKYPILIKCENDSKLKEYLSNEQTSNFVKEHLKQKHLYNSAVFYIRKIDKNDIEDFCWNVIDLTKIDYT